MFLLATFPLGAFLALAFELVLHLGVREPLLFDALEFEHFVLGGGLERCPGLSCRRRLVALLLEVVACVIESTDCLVVLVGLHELGAGGCTCVDARSRLVVASPDVLEQHQRPFAGAYVLANGALCEAASE